MMLPQRFDENEWFVIIVTLLSYSVLLLIPKHLPKSIMIMVMLFSSTVARLFDHLLSSPKLNLYDLMDAPKYEVFDLLTYLLYPPFAYVFIYLFNKLKIRGFWIVLYILLWSIVGTMFEWLTVIFGIFNYNNWKLSYSFTVYLIVQSLTLLFFQYLIHVHALDRKEI